MVPHSVSPIHKVPVQVDPRVQTNTYIGSNPHSRLADAARRAVPTYNRYAVLGVDDDATKARFRRAVANRKLGDSEEAMKDLKYVLDSDSQNKAFRKELALLQKNLKQDHNHRLVDGPSLLFSSSSFSHCRCHCRHRCLLLSILSTA